jgi:hypothetical protein
MSETSNCTTCNTRMDPVWVEIGETQHQTCKTGECDHGEIRGPRYCALCRYENPWIAPPTPPARNKRKKKLTPVG